MAHLHCVGVAGSFMAGVARLACELGHEVSGSDKAFYPPFGEEVRKLGIPLYEGYDADCSARPADLYLIGNAISRGNPLMESILRRRAPFISAPQWLYENILRQRRVLAVAGTHGKTTTTALLAHLLDAAGLAPGFLVGGVLPGFATSARLSPESELFVIEADEYDTAFFDKRPKFLHYHPQVVILNNLEFDHADIYANVQSIILQFHYLLRSVADNGQVIAAGNDAHLAAAIAKGCYTPVQHFGTAENWHWQLADGQMSLHRGSERIGTPFPPPLPGAANRDNTVAALAAAAAVGVEVARAGELLANFQPPLRRMQCVAEGGGIRVFDDFAHHPTAIGKTIAALAEQQRGDGRLVAVFEPRSNTMKAGVFRSQWKSVFSAADVVLAVGEQEWLPSVLADCGDKVHIATNAREAAAYLKRTTRSGDDILLMSNGDFGGLAGMVREFVEEK